LQSLQDHSESVWLDYVRCSLLTSGEPRRLTPRFSADRTVREYTEQHYLPAATAYHSRVVNKGAIGRQMLVWQHTLEQKWASLRFGEVKVETHGEQQVFEVQVCLNDIDPKVVR
jgi:starch phosphorylase